MSAQLWGGLITLVGIGAAFGALVVVHVLPTGLNPLRDPVSQHHLTRYRMWIGTSTICAGVAGIGTIMALTGMLGSGAIACSVPLRLFAATWSTVFGAVMAVGAGGLLVGVITRRMGLFGFFERLIYAGFIAWFVLIGGAALSAPGG